MKMATYAVFNRLHLRLLIAALIGITSGLICHAYQIAFARGGGDFGWSMLLFVDLIAGRDPYGYSTSLTPMSYPLTAGLASAPFTLFPQEVASGIFIGLSSALLAMGLTREGAWWRLLTFLAMPYWAALITVQWSPLLFAVALYPVLLPLTLCKPHIGFPIAVTRLTWRRAIACAVFGLASLLVMPDWPLRWLGHQAAPEQYIPPLLTLPLGPLLLLALLRWRDERTHFMLIFSLVPQRLWYDILLLFLVVRTPRQMLILTITSWLAYAIWFFAPELAPFLPILLLYFPILGFILLPVTPAALDTQSSIPATE